MAGSQVRVTRGESLRRKGPGPGALGGAGQVGRGRGGGGGGARPLRNTATRGRGVAPFKSAARRPTHSRPHFAPQPSPVCLGRKRPRPAPVRPRPV